MRSAFGQAWQAIGRYAANDNPLAQASNTVALVVLSNQPFYPLYIYWLVSPDIAPSAWLFLSSPLYLAVPLVARWHSLAGRALLPIAGIVNTMIGARVFGVASGVEMFLIPCGLIAFAFFRPGERLLSVLLGGLSWAAFIVARDWYGAPLHAYSVEEYASFVRLNATSVGTLCAFTGILTANIIAEGKRAA